MKRKLIIIGTILSVIGCAGILFYGWRAAHLCASAPGAAYTRSGTAKSRAPIYLNLAKRRIAWNILKKQIENRIRGYDGQLGIVIKDLDTDWEYAHNKDLSVPSASIVKIPVMLSCYYADREGKLNLQERIELKGADKAGGSGVLKAIKNGSVFSVEDIIYVMINHSDNTATNLLIKRLGFDLLNFYFKKMGATHTNIERKMMDFSQRRQGVENYTTAGDMAKLLEMLYRKRFLSRAVSDKCINLMTRQKINDRIPKELPSGLCIAHKTGLERNVCHDVGIVYTDKGDFLICVLAKHRYKSARVTKKVIADISLYTYDYFSGL